MRTTAISRAIAIACTAYICTTCVDAVQPDPGIAVAKVQITPSRVELIKGETATLVAAALDTAGAPIPDAPATTWISREPSKVSVSAQGSLTALDAPTSSPDMIFYVVAQIGDARDSAQVYLHKRVARIQFSVQGTPVTEASVPMGDTLSIYLTVLDSANAPFYSAPFSWTSRDPVLLGPSNGYFVADPTHTGSTYLLATALGVTDSILVRVTPTFYVWPDTSAMLPGITRQLRLESFKRSTGIVQVAGSSTWTSSDPAIASVNGDGIVTANAVGDATITVSRDATSLEAHIRVFSYPSPLAFTSISTGSILTCALTNAGQVYCWGSNDEKQLGTTAMMDRCETATITGTHGGVTFARRAYQCSALPRRVETDVVFRDVKVGPSGACGLSTGNSVYCWGSAYALLRSAPTLLPGPEFQSISLGDAQACGIGVNGLGYCWGNETNGARGDGPGRTIGFSAVQVSSAKGWSAVSAAFDVSCALDTTGIPYCWGHAPVTGTLGDMSASCYLRCIEVPTLVAVDPRYAAVRFTQVAAAGGTNCAIGTDAKLYCWGGENFAGGRTVSLRPAVSQPAKAFTHVSTALGGLLLPCALTADGAAYCVGNSATGADDDAFPVFAMDLGVPLKKISTSGDSFGYGCGIGFDDIAYCWGSGSTQLGDGSISFRSVPRSTPTRVAGQP